MKFLGKLFLGFKLSALLKDIEVGESILITKIAKKGVSLSVINSDTSK